MPNDSPQKCLFRLISTTIITTTTKKPQQQKQTARQRSKYTPSTAFAPWSFSRPSADPNELATIAATCWPGCERPKMKAEQAINSGSNEKMGHSNAGITKNIQKIVMESHRWTPPTMVASITNCYGSQVVDTTNNGAELSDEPQVASTMIRNPSRAQGSRLFPMPYFAVPNHVVMIHCFLCGFLFGILESGLNSLCAATLPLLSQLDSTPWVQLDPFRQHSRTVIQCCLEIDIWNPTASDNSSCTRLSRCNKSIAYAVSHSCKRSSEKESWTILNHSEPVLTNILNHY